MALWSWYNKDINRMYKSVLEAGDLTYQASWFQNVSKEELLECSVRLEEIIVEAEKLRSYLYENLSERGVPSFREPQDLISAARKQLDWCIMLAARKEDTSASLLDEIKEELRNGGKSKYISLSFMLHPDRGGDEEMFKVLQEAWRSISN